MNYEELALMADDDHDMSDSPYTAREKLHKAATKVGIPVHVVNQCENWVEVAKLIRERETSCQ